MKDRIRENGIDYVLVGDYYILDIESTHCHDFKFCKCGAVAVDGGKDYLRRCGNREEWEELSKYFDQRIGST